MHQATVRGFAWLDACNRKPKAELLPDTSFQLQFTPTPVFIGIQAIAV